MVEVGRDSTILILNDQDLASDKILGRSLGNDLVCEGIEMDQQIFSNGAGVMDGEQEIQVNIPERPCPPAVPGLPYPLCPFLCSVHQIVLMSI